MAIAVFNWSTSTLNTATATPETAWSLLFPELASYVGQPLAQSYYGTAGFLCDNTNTGIVPAGLPNYQRDTFLNYISAHFAKLYAQNGSTPASPLVGRISSATEGSVSLAIQLVNNPSDQMAFFMQTQYGLMYWTMSQAYRTGFYVPPPCNPDPGIFGIYNGTPGYMNPFWNGGGYG